MQADFLDAHKRHWEDAERLFQAQRWANADHLYGMAAECGLKRLMQAFGMPLDVSKDRPLKQEDRCRIPDDWIDTKRFALFMARDVLRALIEQLQAPSVPSP